MTHHIHGCACCNPVFGELFRAGRSQAEFDALLEQNDGAPFSLSQAMDRRTVLKAGAALTGTAVLTMAAPPRAVAQPSQTTIFRNGTILPVDEEFSQAEALAIRGDRILAVGSADDVAAAAGDDAAIIDLKGRTLLPGFVEAHTHALTGAVIDSTMDFVGVSRFGTTAEVLDHLRALAAETSEGDWIAARNFDPSLQEGPAALTFRDLDAVSDKHPVFVLNASGHIAYANRAAFEAAGITEAVENPPGAEFVRDASGKLNGTMKNSVAFLRVIASYPAIANADPVKALNQLTAKFNTLGLTTCSDLGMGALTNGATDWALYRKAAAGGGLRTRIRVYPFYPFDEAWDKAGVQPGDGDEMVRLAGYKLVADGSNQGFTGLQREPYLNSDSTGLAYMEPEDMKRLALKRAGQGWQIAIHGNGDRGIDNALDAFEAVREAGIDFGKLRPRIEHCSILHDEQIARMKDLGVSASFLIGHVYFWGVAFRDDVFGEAKSMLLDRAKSCENAGVDFSLHSDFMVTDPDPLHMIEMAVTRSTFKEPDYVLAPDERISVESAIRAMTSEAAWQLGSEHEIGSLAPGKLADLVILDQDPRKVAPDAIKSVRVNETWLNGEQVYKA